MARPFSFRIPRPTTFLHFFTLRTGLLLILLTQLVNKVTAFYGILALLTSYPLSPLQLSMYIYSLAILALTLYLIPGVRKQDPWAALVFAQSYAVDTIINAVYTAAFSTAWFAVVAVHDAQQQGPASPYASSNITTSTPVGNGSAALDVLSAQDSVAVGSDGSAAPGFMQGMLSAGSLMSLVIVLAIEALRVYAVFVALSYARAVIRRHVLAQGAGASAGAYAPYAAGSSADFAADPFAADKDEGKGWKGASGRVLVGIGRAYWLGRDDDADDELWMRQLGGKFRKSDEQAGGGGTTERERRRRSGTDPPKPAPGVVA